MVTNNAHSGIYHWSDAGVASWYDFAIAIYEEALNFQLLDKTIKIIPVSTLFNTLPLQKDLRTVCLTSSLTNKIWGVSTRTLASGTQKDVNRAKKLIQISNELIKS